MYETKIVGIIATNDLLIYTANGKCIALANTLPNTIIWQQCTGLKDKNILGFS